MKELLSLLNFDAGTKEGITNITVWLAMLVYFLFLNFFVVPVDVSGEKPNYIFYLFVLFVPAAVRLIFFSGDSISFRNNSEAKFFQGQFPHKYIATKYGIAKPLAQHLWFGALDKKSKEGAAKKTYQYGYTCRLVYYLRRLILGFSLVSIALLLGSASSIYWRQCRCWSGFREIPVSFLSIPNIRGKAFYLLHLALIFSYLSWANRPNEQKPTGVWARWKEINDRHKAWIDQFKTLDDFQKWVSSPLPVQGTGNQAAAKPKDNSQNEDKEDEEKED